MLTYIRNHPRTVVGQAHQTPDNAKASTFRITVNSRDTLSIETAGGSTVVIPWQKFGETLKELLQIGYETQVDIGSSKDEGNRTGLAVAVEPTGTMHINYILPILAEVGFVLIDGTRRPKNGVKLI